MLTIEQKKSLQKLVVVADQLNAAGIPSCCYEDDGVRESAHWHGTLDNMKAALGRNLTEEEITLLSLSRAYGPSPAVADVAARAVIDSLFHDGTGRYYTWAYMKQHISKIVVNG